MTSETPTISQTYEVVVYDDFDSMNLPEKLLMGIYGFGFEKPSDIQKRAIMPIVEGRDLLAQARSGTGKTGTFTIGSLSRVDPKLEQVQVLILSPTHELAKQTYDVVCGIGKPMGIKAHFAVGGSPVKKDIEMIERGCQVLIGTPGRIYDLGERGVLNRKHIRVLIMDEADQMLADKFLQQVTAILKLGFPEQTRVCLFSATMPKEIVKLTDGLLHDPVKILVENREVPLEGIKQYFVALDHEEWKFDVLCDIYSQLHINQAMIYCNKQQRADWLAMKLKDAKFTVECFHGGMSHEERTQRMEEFRAGSCRVLISTDVTARGIDVQHVSTVINFDIPSDKENYIHRSGRCGRYGRKGVVINFVAPNDMRLKQELEEHWETVWMPLPQNLKTLAG